MFTSKPTSQNGSDSAQRDGSGESRKSGNGRSMSNWLGKGWSGNGHRIGNGFGNGSGHNKGIASVLGPGMHYQGTMTGVGAARIEGTFDGTVNIKGPLVIADGAKVTADIQAGAVSVAGSVKGNIRASKVEILSTGRVWGDLITAAFATEEGAFLRGLVQMEDEVPPPAALEETQPHTVTA